MPEGTEDILKIVKDIAASPEFQAMLVSVNIDKAKERIAHIDSPDPSGAMGRKRKTYRITTDSKKTYYVNKLPSGAAAGDVFDTESRKVSRETTPPAGEKESPLATWKKLGVKAPNFKSWFGDWEKDPENASKVVDETGKPLVVYHGTTNLFDAFNMRITNIESDFGRGAYFTSDTDDVNANYAGVGPDLTSRIDRLAEQIESNEEISYEEAKKKAKEKLTQHSGSVIPAYLAIKKPVYIGGDKETYLDYSFGPTEDDIEHFMEDARRQLMEDNQVGEGEDPAAYFSEDEVRDKARDMAVDNGYESESGTLLDFINGLERAAAKYDSADVAEAVQELRERAMDGITAREAVETLKKSEGLAYATDENGELASSEIIREAFENMGFDGVIDRTVNEKFGSERKMGRSMEGMGYGTVHYIAFFPGQVKSAIGNSGVFDPNSNEIKKALEAAKELNKRVSVPPEVVEIVQRIVSDPEFQKYASVNIDTSK